MLPVVVVDFRDPVRVEDVPDLGGMVYISRDRKLTIRSVSAHEKVVILNTFGTFYQNNKIK